MEKILVTSSSTRFLKLTNSSLRLLIRESILSVILEGNDGHKWSRANDSLLMLDKEGIEKSDRDNVSNFLKAMGMMD